MKQIKQKLTTKTNTTIEITRKNNVVANAKQQLATKLNLIETISKLKPTQQNKTENKHQEGKQQQTQPEAQQTLTVQQQKPTLRKNNKQTTLKNYRIFQQTTMDTTDKQNQPQEATTNNDTSKQQTPSSTTAVTKEQNKQQTTEKREGKGRKQQTPRSKQAKPKQQANTITNYTTTKDKQEEIKQIKMKQHQTTTNSETKQEEVNKRKQQNTTSSSTDPTKLQVKSKGKVITDLKSFLAKKKLERDQKILESQQKCDYSGVISGGGCNQELSRQPGHSSSTAIVGNKINSNEGENSRG